MTLMASRADQSRPDIESINVIDTRVTHAIDKENNRQIK